MDRSYVFNTGTVFAVIGGGGGVLSFFETLSTDYKTIGLAVSVSVMVFGLCMMAYANWFMDDPKKEQAMADDFSIKVGNIIGNANQIGHNFGPVQRALNDASRAQLLAKMPKELPLRLYTLAGDNEAVVFAQEIQAFLKDQGYAMEGGLNSIVPAGGMKGILLQKSEDGTVYEIYVGSQ